MPLKIITDAASNLYPEVLKEKDSSIEVLPMSLSIGGKDYVCYDGSVDVMTLSHDFYEAMRAGQKPRTSLPSVGIFAERFKKALDEGFDVLYVSLSSAVSGTFQAASLVAASLNDELGASRIAVIDSKSAGFGEGMVALYAESLAKEGLSLSEAAAKVEGYTKCLRSEFTVDNIKYLANTGRVSKFAAVLAGALMIKPLLYGDDEGRIVVTSKVQGRKNSFKRLAEQISQHIKDKESRVYVTHCDDPEDTKYLLALLAKQGIENVEVHPYDLVTGSHVGPGTVACFYEGTDRSLSKKTIVDAVSSVFSPKKEKK